MKIKEKETRLNLHEPDDDDDDDDDDNGCVEARGAYLIPITDDG